MLPHKNENKYSDSILDSVQNVLNKSTQPTSIWETGSYVDHAQKLELPETKENKLSEDRIDKLIDKVFSGDDGDDLGNAWEKGDKKSAMKILISNKVNSNDAKQAVARIFGEEKELKESISSEWQAGAKKIRKGNIEFVRSSSPDGVHVIIKSGKVVGDFSLDYDQWVVNIGKKQFTFDELDDVYALIKKTVKEEVSVDARTKGFRDAHKRVEGYKAKRSVTSTGLSEEDEEDEEEIEEKVKLPKVDPKKAALRKKIEKHQSKKKKDDWFDDEPEEKYKVKRVKGRIGQDYDAGMEEGLDVSKVNKLIEGIAEAIDTGKKIDYIQKGEVIKQLSDSGIKWDRSILSRLHLETLGLGSMLVLDEAKTDYTIYHKTFSDAVQEGSAACVRQGYMVDEEDWWRVVATGPSKPSNGKTNRYTVDLLDVRTLKPSKKSLHMQVYNDGNRYELNMYIS